MSEARADRNDHRLGAHPDRQNGTQGTRFAVWAPHAREVSVVGEFNHWKPGADPMTFEADSGIWTRFLPGVSLGALYKFAITPGAGGAPILKADPVAFAAERPPGTASKVWNLDDYTWNDAEWLARRASANALDSPIAIYEVHLGSWMRSDQPGHPWLTYREIATRLADHASEMGFTHVELMPLTEFPFDGSWGYQVTGYHAATARFGTPQDLMALVDTLHQKGLGVLLDWVPAHFPRDAHGLADFDGEPLYEPADPRRGFNAKWNTANFDFGRPEVVTFLIDNARFWLDRFHLDGLRVDAVEALLHLDFGKGPGQWLPNIHGGRDNLEAIAFLQRFNQRIHQEFPGVLTIAEDSTARPGTTKPVEADGLGFDLKWDLGWVHDTLDHYMTLEPQRRSEAHRNLIFRMHYAFQENYLLPLSHDEVVLGKKAFLEKMPGDDWRKFANLRLLLGLMYALPGKKLMFMGTELAERREWDHDGPARLVAYRGPPPPRAPPLGPRPQRPLSNLAGAPSTRLPPRRVRLGRQPRRGPEHRQLPEKSGRSPRRPPRRRQLHAQPPPQLPDRRASRGILARSPQRRRRNLRRGRPGEPRRSRSHPHPRPRSRPVGRTDLAPTGDRGLPTGRLACQPPGRPPQSSRVWASLTSNRSRTTRGARLDAPFRSRSACKSKAGSWSTRVGPR